MYTHKPHTYISYFRYQKVFPFSSSLRKSELELILNTHKNVFPSTGKPNLPSNTGMILYNHCHYNII